MGSLARGLGAKAAKQQGSIIYRAGTREGAASPTLLVTLGWVLLFQNQESYQVTRKGLLPSPELPARGAGLPWARGHASSPLCPPAWPGYGTCAAGKEDPTAISAISLGANVTLMARVL